MPLTALEKTTSKLVDAASTLFLAIELSLKTWKLGFTDGKNGLKEINVAGGDFGALVEKVKWAKKKFDLAEDCRVLTCQEAGRDGFSVHRQLVAAGFESLVVDSSSIEMNRRERQAKTDRLDVRKLVQMLVRYDRSELGEKVWSVLRVPTERQEAERRLHREAERLKKEKTALGNRIRSLLLTHGIGIGAVSPNTPVDALRQWNGHPLPDEMREELKRALERYRLVISQLKTVTNSQKARREADTPTVGAQKERALMELRGIGPVIAGVLAYEFFFREFANRKEVGAAAGLTGTPFASGSIHRERGISKAGNPLVRAKMVELAWLWLRHQPDSDLAQWFQRKWGSGSKGAKCTGITALARKLLVALWHYVEHGVVPAGAVMKREIEMQVCEA